MPSCAASTPIAASPSASRAATARRARRDRIGRGCWREPAGSTIDRREEIAREVSTGRTYRLPEGTPTVAAHDTPSHHPLGTGERAVLAEHGPEHRPAE